MVSKLDLAREAVEERLKINDFIKNNNVQLYGKLEKCDLGVKNQPESDLLFIAECLPLINGIVQIGSTLADFNGAIQWIREKLPDAVPVSILSALTFIYIVETAIKDDLVSKDAAKKEIWKRIHERVKKLYVV